MSICTGFMRLCRIPAPAELFPAFRTKNTAVVFGEKSMKTEIVGNTNLIQNDEELISDYLRKRNLEMVNSTAKPVHPKASAYTRYFKRILDLLIAVPAFLILLPLNLVFGILTFLDVGRPIFYIQTRIGLNGKPFNIVKFRNMNNKKDADGKLLPARERVTKFGLFMRSHSFDELLNFLPVIKGDMSIIGPRPLPAFFYDRFSERHKMRCAVRPGLECPRVINVEGEQYQRQFENDIWYVENVSFAVDVKLLILLFKMTFAKKDRISAPGGSYFVGYDDNGRAIYKELALELYGKEMEKAGIQ